MTYNWSAKRQRPESVELMMTRRDYRPTGEKGAGQTVGDLAVKFCQLSSSFFTAIFIGWIRVVSFNCKSTATP